MNPIDLHNVPAADLRAALKQQDEKKEADRKNYKLNVKTGLTVNLGKLIALSEEISNVKTEIFKGFEAVVKQKKALYNVKATQQSHTFTNDEGEGITIGFRVTDGWDDTVNEGISKINEYIASLAKDTKSAEVVSMLNHLLKKDTKGNLKANRVLDLETLADKSNNENFRDGVQIIRSAYKPVKSCYFIDAFTVDATQKKQTIPLSISSANFTGGYEFKIQDSNS